MMDFTRDLLESRMTRDENGMSRFSYTDCCERVFLIIMALENMNQYPSYQDTVKRYVRSTLAPGKFEHYRISGTDLYNFIYFVNGNEDALVKLRDPQDAARVRGTMIPPVGDIQKYLRSLQQGRDLPNKFSVLQKIERNLRINNSDYQALRRWTANIRSISQNDRKLLATRLIYAFRAKLRSSDIIDDVERWASDKNLETRVGQDPEPMFSSPDVPLGDLSMYRYLTGADRLSLLKQFVQHAKSGKGANAQLVTAYLPIIEIVDDIVAGGPAYIQQLKLLQQKAKRSPRK